MSTAADSGSLPENDTPRTGSTSPEPGDDATPEQIEADIARTRRELGDTVGALTEKLDPKAQAERQADHLKEQARDQVDRVRTAAQSKVSQGREAMTGLQGRPMGIIAAAAGAATFGAIGLLIARNMR